MAKSYMNTKMTSIIAGSREDKYFDSKIHEKNHRSNEMDFGQKEQ